MVSITKTDRLNQTIVPFAQFEKKEEIAKAESVTKKTPKKALRSGSGYTADNSLTAGLNAEIENMGAFDPRINLMAIFAKFFSNESIDNNSVQKDGGLKIKADNAKLDVQNLAMQSNLSKIHSEVYKAEHPPHPSIWKEVLAIVAVVVVAIVLAAVTDGVGEAAVAPDLAGDAAADTAATTTADTAGDIELQTMSTVEDMTGDATGNVAETNIDTLEQVTPAEQGEEEEVEQQVAKKVAKSGLKKALRKAAAGGILAAGGGTAPLAGKAASGEDKAAQAEQVAQDKMAENQVVSQMIQNVIRKIESELDNLFTVKVDNSQKSEQSALQMASSMLSSWVTAQTASFRG